MWQALDFVAAESGSLKHVLDKSALFGTWHALFKGQISSAFEDLLCIWCQLRAYPSQSSVAPDAPMMSSYILVPKLSLEKKSRLGRNCLSNAESKVQTCQFILVLKDSY